MENSILKSVKEVLGLAQQDSGFDLEIITYLNSALVTLQQIGVVYEIPQISDDTAVWSDLSVVDGSIGIVRSYINLKTQMLWDPPATSFLIGLKNEQIKEYEVRLNLLSEVGPHGS